MTAKHFEMIAAAFRRSRPDPNSSHHIQWEKDVEAIASACAEVNPNFNRSRFVDACEADDKYGR